MAQQQKLLLEHYGGIASARGDQSGKAIGILGPLNELVGPIVGVRFYAQEITEDLTTVLGKVRSQIDDGLSVPLLINFQGSPGAHFIMVMRYQYDHGNYQYLIYDPWTGLCDYVAQTSLLSGSLAPLNTTHAIRVSYYYPAVTLSAVELEQLHQLRKG